MSQCPRACLTERWDREQYLGILKSIYLSIYLMFFPCVILYLILCHAKCTSVLTLYVLNFSEGTKNIFIFYVISPHWQNTCSWKPSSSKTRTYLFYIVNIIWACWCPGDAKSQEISISNHDIYYDDTNWFGPRTLTVKLLAPGRNFKEQFQNMFSWLTWTTIAYITGVLGYKYWMLILIVLNSVPYGTYNTVIIGPISLRVYELITEMIWKFSLL